MEIVNEFFNGAVKILKPKVHGDSRGFFMESYNQKTLESVGITDNFVQDNHSFSAEKGTIRGLHFQNAPMAQSKLVRVVKGAVLDVFIDIRIGSPTFGQFEQMELSAENYLQAYIPRGFAHGFCTLTNDTHFCYKVDNFYSHPDNNGIIWNDNEIGIKWPVDEPILSDQDAKWGSLKELPEIFKYEDFQ